MKKLTPRQAQIRFQSIASVIQECQSKALVLLAAEVPRSKTQESQNRRAVTLNQKRLNEALTRMVLFCASRHTNLSRLSRELDREEALKLRTEGPEEQSK